MPMVGNDMAASIVADIAALPDADKADTTKVWETICTSMVAYMAANAEVTVTNVTGVTVGGGVSGPGTGTIS